MKRLIFVASVVVLILAFVFAASELRERRAERLDFMAREDAATFVRPHSPTLGPEDARVHLVEFTDPACATCAAFSPVVKHFLRTYTGKVQLVLRYAPFHQGSEDVVRVVEAARTQGRFWETLDLLYRNQEVWTRNHRVDVTRVFPLLSRMGLDVERLKEEMDDPRITEIIRQDLADAETLGVRRTPGFFVNGRPLEPFGAEELAALVESEVQAQYPE